MKKNKYNVKWVWVKDKENEPWKARIFIADGEKVFFSWYKQMKPFTPKDFFNYCLPDWLAEKAVANIGNNNNKQFSNCIETLKGCFEWEKTHEGLDFWCDVLNHMENPEECGLPYNPITEEEVPEESPFNQFKCKCVDISSLDKIVNYCFLCGRKLK